MKKVIFAILLCSSRVFAQSYGPVQATTAFDIKFTTRSTAGAPTTLSGTPVVSIYKDHGLTESTAGVALTVDFDSRTGLNNVNIDTSADTNFYSVGSYFQVVITTGTVSGTSVAGEVVGSFTIGGLLTLRKNVAFNNFPIWMLNTSGAGVTNQIVTCQIQKDGGAWANTNSSPLAIGLGKYVVNLSSSETNANVISLLCTAPASNAIAYRTNITPQQ